MAILVYADHNNQELSSATLNAVTAASQLGGDVHVLVAGSGAQAVADAAARIAKTAHAQGTTLREAALALGIERWKTTLFITVRTASAGILTGILLAMARILGETAPLLFTALGNQFWQTGLDQPIAAITIRRSW